MVILIQKELHRNKRLGSGGPGYTVPAEFVEGLFHKKGALSAARQGDQVNPERASSGSQFYIVQGAVTPMDQLPSGPNQGQMIAAFQTCMRNFLILNWPKRIKKY